MKRRITLSIALVLSVVLVSLMSSASTAKAQPGGMRPIADTGIVTFGPNQKLRITVAPAAINETVTVRFRGLKYMQTTCSGGVCKQVISGNTVSDPLVLTPNESAFFDIFVEVTLDAVRGVVLSNSQKVKVTAMIIDTTTGSVVSFFDIFID